LSGSFRLKADFELSGDQPQAVRKLVENVAAGRKCQTLLGVTGSGKTFAMANLIAAFDKPALVISPNKTLSAQLYSEFKEFFPENAVHYFVSYYDYYQPEAYIPEMDIYIEKDARINDEIDRLRLAATSSLMSRRDVIIAASVSCIYGLGSPAEYKKLLVQLERGQEIERRHILSRLVGIQYARNDMNLVRGTFRARGDVVEVFPAYEEFAYRIELFDDEIERISSFSPITGEVFGEHDQVFIYPARHFVAEEGTIERAIGPIEEELAERLAGLKEQGKLLEAQRLESRTRYDLEMLREVGYCRGIENYSRHLADRPAGSRPYTLIDFFPPDYLLFVDESHVTVPQIRGMYHGDRSRKEVLVEHGFRLPSALDNRPMNFEEWEASVNQVVFVSATPSPYELEKCGGEVVEQIIRPTGLVDPLIHVRPARGQVQDLLKAIRKRIERNERVLVTTLTKRLAEELSEYIDEAGYRCRYLHSEIDTIERVEILRDLRKGEFDVLVGINLLREGLDLPEVSLVAILDADKAGFLRSQTSLIQTVGRAARNVNSEVILYADSVTNAMKNAIAETTRRREIQLAHNREHGITPETIRKEIRKGIEEEISGRDVARTAIRETEVEYVTQETLRELEEEMREAAEALEFERAAEIRDRIMDIVDKLGGKISTNLLAGKRFGRRRGGRARTL
jgi:excinuclease ABC subunit B